MAKRKKKVLNPRVIRTRKNVQKTRNLGQWTEAMYFQKIRNALRSAFRYYSPLQAALKAASRPSQNKSNPRLKFEYECALCGKFKKRADVEIDHIKSCGSLNCMEDIVPFIERLTTENISDYQILCKTPCHREKTLKENAERRNTKKLNLVKPK